MNDAIAKKVNMLQSALRERMNERLQRQLLPYEGQWLDAPTLAREMRRARREAWVRAAEILLLIALLAGASLFLVGLTNTLAY